MARSADVLAHPVTGERLVWRRVARDTNGALLEGDICARPGGHPAASHVHPNQQERFRVLDGKIMLKVAGEETILLQDSAPVPPGQPHTWRNLGVEQAHIRVEWAPPLRRDALRDSLRAGQRRQGEPQGPS